MKHNKVLALMCVEIVLLCVSIVLNLIKLLA